jgi:hypothetical protein
MNKKFKIVIYILLLVLFLFLALFFNVIYTKWTPKEALNDEIANNEIVSYENGGYTKRLGAYENHSGTNSEEVLVWAEKLETLNKTATTDDANYIKNEWRSSIRTGGASRKYQI